jgi:predicted membrane protein
MNLITFIIKLEISCRILKIIYFFLRYKIMKGFGKKHKNLKKKKRNSDERTIKDQIISRAFKQHSQGNFQEAKKVL